MPPDPGDTQRDLRPGRDAPGETSTTTAQPSGTITGMLLSGRYRLRTRVGSDTAAGAEFWRAEDTMLRRDVAISVLRRLAADPAGDDADPAADGESVGSTRAGEMMVRALRSGSFEHTGCARLLDVLAPGSGGMPPDVLGAAVTEWIPGKSLAEVVSDGLIKPTAVARGVAPLAAAAEAAHRRGLVLGIDHPQRVRVTPEGKVMVCFALPRPTVTPADDVRGLGAVLYVLLTSHWPLSGVDAARAGLAATERPPSGELPTPSLQRPGVPVELDTLVIGTLGPEDAPGHVHTAAAVHRLLDEVIAEDDRLALFPPEHDGVPSSPGDVWQDDDAGQAQPDPGRRRKLLTGVAVLAVAVVGVLVFLSIQFGSLLSDDGGEGPAIVVSTPPVAQQGGEPGEPAPAPAPGAVGDVVAAAGVEVYDKAGTGDNSGRVAQVIDGDGGSSWKTSTYKDQFPVFKPGIGIMVSFASPVSLAEISIESPSAGTVVQVKAAQSADDDVEEMSTIGEATLSDGTTAVSLDGGEPVAHVLVWITRLSGGGSENSSQINELEFRRTAVG
ncbi:protein kinase family protein [Pseudonocardia humida]|uniref:Protein kinase family protein n=1 Tax=Pseudonocardia humida TaxID=2800819 RepID=A0ABT1ABC0_9PSEU|nr:protein kinase family protein [Pseudonocardia humida]MCO1660340.1 protein kinase family protein [Pseudonocardia humida]